MAGITVQDQQDTTTQILVVALDPNAPAREGGKAAAAFERARIAAKTTRHTITREPDFVDEVAGEAGWMGDDFMVTVPVEALNGFRAWVNSGGSGFMTDHRVHQLTRFEPSFRDVLDAVRPIQG